WSSDEADRPDGCSPRSGRSFCHDCRAQYEPSGSLQAATLQASGGPSYGRQRSPPGSRAAAYESANRTWGLVVLGARALSAPQARTCLARPPARYVTRAWPWPLTANVAADVLKPSSCEADAAPATSRPAATATSSTTNLPAALRRRVAAPRASNARAS